MREIKFRAWDADNRKMLDPDYLAESGLGWVFNNDGFHPMQYTGLKDKNGVEIYDFDLLKDEHGHVAIVHWYQPNVEFMLTDLEEWVHERGSKEEPAYIIDTTLGWPGLEVIGNIMENPELLK